MSRFISRKPFIGPIAAGDEPHYLMIAESLVSDHRVQV
jgi:hypothetical protein